MKLSEPSSNKSILYHDIYRHGGQLCCTSASNDEIERGKMEGQNKMPLSES
jgi:hypothetical protein